ncbi:MULTISPECIES: dTDP-4-dehydrorhamnose 3,5-epimerase family protein [unclassified Ruegeria]|uniref:dTDP-4-dehydrorhamnose 3,5-epimerase family protein n=1 Tax=unclassified Ruegeria TaxID=2625375 RepID=UPI0014895146|nr:hypothetical protein [Ruegeria sp. HKCCD6428]NOC94155.1 hypothetical protein [Ruegeria sp. HKCCD6604]
MTARRLKVRTGGFEFLKWIQPFRYDHVAGSQNIDPRRNQSQPDLQRWPFAPQSDKSISAPDCDRAVRWDDPNLGIDWPLTGAPVLSDKDAAAPLMADLDNPLTWNG